MPLDTTPVPDELRGLRISLLISGGVAAYKVVDLASALAQAGCDVRVAMTASAQRFVGAPTFQGVTGNAAVTSLWSADGSPEPHVFLGDWAQLILVAPATANVIGRIAQGRSDDIVTATVMAARSPVVVAPAMNDAMWSKPAVQENLSALRRRGFTIAEPESGRLASGHVGAGRLAGAGAIFGAMAHAVRARYDYAGRRVVVTAGGTREPIDPVRFIGNYSSGKMGFALAVAAAERGARVTLITTASHPGHHGIEPIAVETAGDMLRVLKASLAGADALFMAAAVADFRPATTATGKIRREDTKSLTLQLEAIPDLLAEVAGDRAGAAVYRVGFAAEDSALEKKAGEKIKRKGLDAIVANDISRSDIGFGSDFNAGALIFADGSRHELERATKREMADRILTLVLPHLKSR